MRLHLALLLLLEGASASSVASDAHITRINVGDHITSACAPNAWSDYVLNVTQEMTAFNLLFEVENTDAPYNPTGMMAAIWTGSPPSSRQAEHRVDRATGKVWALGMNNNCFSLGDITLGVKCGPIAMNYVLHVINVSAILEPNVVTQGEVRVRPAGIFCMRRGRACAVDAEASNLPVMSICMDYAAPCCDRPCSLPPAALTRPPCRARSRAPASGSITTSTPLPSAAATTAAVTTSATR